MARKTFSDSDKPFEMLTSNEVSNELQNFDRKINIQEKPHEKELNPQPTTLQQNRPVQISEDIQPGYFYRTSKGSGSGSQEVIGVYAKSVEYCGETLAKDENFETIEKYMQAHKKESNTYLGVCFFGVLRYQNDANEDKLKMVQFPVNTTEDPTMITIWTTKQGLNNERSGKFNLSSIPRNNSDRIHTEEKAIQYLEENLKKLLEHLVNEADKAKMPQERVIECIGFHFLSNVDACDECLNNQLVRFLKRKEDLLPLQAGSYKVDNTVSFLITYTAANFYHPEYRNFYTPHYNVCHSASLLYKPSELQLLYVPNVSAGRTKLSDLMSQYIEHQNTVRLNKGEEFNYVVLTVNEGKRVEVKYLLRFV